MRERRGGGGGQPARGVENRSARGRGRDGCPCRRAAAAAARVARASERERIGQSELEIGGEGGRRRRGRFFPIKQPAEFVFSPKRRCRFKVIDCHPGVEEEEEEVEGFAGASEGGCAAERFRYMWGRV